MSIYQNDIMTPFSKVSTADGQRQLHTLNSGRADGEVVSQGAQRPPGAPLNNSWFTVENRVNTAHNPKSFQGIGGSVGQKTFYGGHNLRRNIPLVQKNAEVNKSLDAKQVSNQKPVQRYGQDYWEANMGDGKINVYSSNAGVST